MTTAHDIILTLRGMENAQQAQVLQRFFKTGKGQYGEGDLFLGLKVPQTRSVVKEARLDVTLEEIGKLLLCPWHEVRLCGLLLLVEEMKAALPKRSRRAPTGLTASTAWPDGGAGRREEIARFYLAHAHRANNWDLVALSCGPIVGLWLLHPSATGALPDRGVLDRLARSANLWEQRISIVSTGMLIRHGQFDDTLRIAAQLLPHPHDLIHKAVGWMLREVGKRDIEVLRDFLAEHLHALPRTTLRYAIERMPADERAHWMKG